MSDLFHQRPYMPLSIGVFNAKGRFQKLLIVTDPDVRVGFGS